MRGHTFSAPKPRPPIVCAHGGASSAAAPPNTAEAFLAALRLGADCVEVDAARTRDGHLVVLHVRELLTLVAMAPPEKQRALLGTKDSASQLQVGDLTLAQLRGLRWRPGGQRVMDVGAALALTKAEVSLVTLDVKTYQDRWRARGNGRRFSPILNLTLPLCSSVMVGPRTALR